MKGSGCGIILTYYPGVCLEFLMKTMRMVGVIAKMALSIVFHAWNVPGCKVDSTPVFRDSH